MRTEDPPVEREVPLEEERGSRQIQTSWQLFDVGSWGFCTVAMTYIPVFFKSHDHAQGMRAPNSGQASR